MCTAGENSPKGYYFHNGFPGRIIPRRDSMLGIVILFPIGNPYVEVYKPQNKSGSVRRIGSRLILKKPQTKKSHATIPFLWVNEGIASDSLVFLRFRVLRKFQIIPVIPYSNVLFNPLIESMLV